MYQGNCVYCGRKVRTDGNWLKAYLWGNTAVFDWKCFVSLMKERGEKVAEDAEWSAVRDSKKAVNKQLRVEAAIPGTAHKQEVKRCRSTEL